MTVSNIRFRLATVDDLFAIMRLHQLTSRDPARDGMMVDWQRLRAAISSGTDFWCIGEDATHGLVAAACVIQDQNEAIAKLHRIYVDPSQDDTDAVVKDLLSALLEIIADQGSLDLLYTTTWKQSLHVIDLAQELGFIMLGIFPNVISADASKMNGIAGYFFGDALTEKRAPPAALHPRIEPLFDIVREQAGLANVPVCAPDTRALEASREEAGALPTLEVIDAPSFVARRFERLQARRSLSASFYPFQEPDLLITGPDQEIEIFVRGIPELRFAMIIGERIERSVDVVSLYTEVNEILRKLGLTYIEAVNDAADAVGFECMLRAGFHPSVYFPSLKRHGTTRRDYVVVGRAFEKSRLEPQALNPMLFRFWNAYRQKRGQDTF